MASRRLLIASALTTVLSAASGINSVRFFNNEADLEQPCEMLYASCPMVKLYMGSEDIKYLPNLRAYNKLKVYINIYLLEWDKTSIVQEETLLKAVRDVLGNNISLDNTAVDISIDSIVKNKTEYPLISYQICGIIGYEESIKSL